MQQKGVQTVLLPRAANTDRLRLHQVPMPQHETHRQCNQNGPLRSDMSAPRGRGRDTGDLHRSQGAQEVQQRQVKSREATPHLFNNVRVKRISPFLYVFINISFIIIFRYFFPFYSRYFFVFFFFPLSFFCKLETYRYLDKIDRFEFTNFFFSKIDETITTITTFYYIYINNQSTLCIFSPSVNLSRL